MLYFWGTGVLGMWTLTEYYFHRFRLHREVNIDPEGPTNGKLNGEIFSSHVHHHVFMNQKHRVVLNMGIYLQLVPIGWLIMSLFMTWPVLYAQLGGWIGGSVLYDLMHYSFHHGPEVPFFWW